MSNRTARRSPTRRTGTPLYALLVLALSFGYGHRSLAQQTTVPALGTIDGVTLTTVDTNEFILDAPPSRIQSIIERHNLTIIRSLDSHGHGVYLVRANGTVPYTDLVNQVASDPEVSHFELNNLAIAPEVPSGLHLDQSPVAILDALSDRTIVDYHGKPTWSRYVTQPATAVIRMADAHSTYGTGAGIVAVIDTGVDPNHPQLQDVLVPGYDFVNDTAGTASEWTDLDPATAATLNQSPVAILDQSPVAILDQSPVAILDRQSLIVSLNQSTVAVLTPATAGALNPAALPAAFGHGTMVAGLVHLVAPTAKIMPLKAFKADGSSRVFDIVRAIYYAVEHGARVINMSFSTPELSPEITHAIEYATDQGVICVSSAGNAGRQLLVYPAALRNVLGIGSTTSTATPFRSSFSNYGNALVRLGAPGESVITTYPGNNYVGSWGTSFSTGLVSGAAALLVQKDPQLDPSTAQEYLSKADKMPSLGMGRGRLNLWDAIRLLPDQAAPTVSFVTPAAGTIVRNSITVTASASDNVSVTGVRFLVGNQQIGPEDTSAPYEVLWNTSSLLNGSYTLTAVARDGSGNASSVTVTVNVSNDAGAPTVNVTSPVPDAQLSGVVSVTASASDDGEIASVQFMLDGAPLGAADTAAPYDVAWTTTSATNGEHMLTAVARDTAGKETTSSTVRVVVANDTTAPTVALTTPAPDATVIGTIPVAATAADAGGVASVQFFLDGSALGAPDTEAPYELTWSTAAASSGTHNLHAVARDAAGNETTSASVTVTIANDTAPPNVSVTKPAAGATVSGTVALGASAFDTDTTPSVKFFIDGVAVGTSDPAAPYDGTWDTTSIANGTHTVTAVARDAAGNEATSAGVTVTVFNDASAPTISVTSPAAGTTVKGTVTVGATATDDGTVESVQFVVDGTPAGAADTTAPYELSWNTTGVANGAHTISAVARDGAGRETTSATVSVTVHNDTTAPVVVLAAPATGTTVHGTVTLVATATDDDSVAGVQFAVNGAPAGELDTTAPYEFVWNTTALSNGTHTLTVLARDAAGNEATSAAVTVTVFNDSTAPTVAVTAPAAAATVDGTVTVTASATDDGSVASVKFLVDGALVGAADTTAPYELSWNTTAIANGAHTITAVARDAAGNEATSAAVSVTVFNDTTAPTVAVSSPASAATVNGTVNVTATATDNGSVASVQFLVDGAPAGAADTTAPYELSWNTSAIANGAHTITAVARDAAGNEATSAAVSVTVFNDTTAPTVAVSSPANGGTINGTVNVTATAADDGSVASVQFLIDGAPAGAADTTAPYELSWNTGASANGTHTVTAVARDAAGNQATSAAVSVTVFNDTTAPTVAVTSPTNDTTLNGTVTVTAAAADDAAVASVQFLINGAPAGPADTTAPYELTWNTAAAANGSYLLTAIARDGAGNEGSATAVSVTVFNDTIPPTAAITAPGAGTTVGGTVTVTATASDDAGVASVEFFVDGVALGLPDTAAPYQAAWATSGTPNGTRTLTAVARDAAGNSSTSPAVTLTVFNDISDPVISQIAPASGTTVSGTVTLSANVTDNVGVTSVRFMVDGNTIGIVTAAPYQVTWNTLAVSNGWHEIKIIARDAAANDENIAVNLRVSNDTTAPTVALSSPLAGATVNGVLTLTAAASDDIGVASVQFFVDGVAVGPAVTAAPYAASWSTGASANGAHTLTAVARDAAGNVTTSAAVTVTVFNDTTAPVVAVSGLEDGAAVAGIVSLAATATDDAAVASVEFFIDGLSVGSALTSAPYQLVWDSTAATNGAHTITAVARDSAGNTATSTPVSVTVTNGTPSGLQP